MNRKWKLLALVVLCVASLHASFAQPNITGLSPTSGTVSTSVAITGTNFGSTQGSSTVAFNGTTATTITNWGATSITATVPTGATTGNVVVTVGGVASNGVWFTFNDTYGNGYQYRQAIVLGHANVPNTNQTDFPVLISGVYSYLANVSNGGLVQNTNGYDIIFSQDPEGATQLDYEIDGYDPTTGTVAFWVRIPTLSHTVDTVINMFYGNANITSSQQNLAGVWRNNYLSVYHLGNGSSVGLSDSGSAGYTLSGSATAVVGKIGGGAAFNGNPGTYLYNDSLPAYPSGDSPVTLETWVQFASSTGGQEILGYGANSGNGSRDALYWDGSNIYTELENMYVLGPMPYDSNWHHVVSVYGGGALSTTTDPLYLDGVPLSTSTGGGTPVITSTEFKIGGVPTVTSCCALNGSVDEVRVSSGVRSSDWVATEYANESSPATFYAVEGQATPNSAPTIQILSPSSYPVGAPIIIQGYGFQPTQGASTVTFNGVTASPTAWNDATIVVPVPAGATTGNVVVTVGGVASNGVSFTVFPTPNITSLYPSWGVVGTSVTIAGTNFGATQGASTVAFNGATATTITSWSATSIVATAPTGTTTGNVLVTVGGVVSNGFSFTVVPSIVSVSPPSGTVGASVTITGANFGAAQGTSAVTFNGTAATTITSWGATSIAATVPTGATTGNVVVTVGGIASNGVGFGVCAGVCADYGNGYQYRQTIVVGYANVPNTDQTNFPVLISGVYSYLANVSNGGLVQNPNGYDIVFCSDPEGANPLNYETETYDPATGTVNFWVSIPTLSHTANTIIYLFYGNSSVTTNQSNSTAVWDANYVGVWHLPNGTTLTANDSTSNGRNGTLSGVTATSGQIDGGASFNGSSVITIPTIGSLSGPFTIEEWARPGSTSGSLGLFGSRSPSDESFDAKLTGGLVHADIGSGSGWLTTSADAAFSYSVNSWHDFVYAVSDTGYQIFADGASIGSGSFNGTPLLFDSNHILEIGGTGYGGEEFVGTIDEVRVSSTLRSADWIATEYASESSPSTFYTMEGEATPNSAPTIQFLSSATGLIGSSVTIQGYGFQSTQGASTVTFNGVTAIPTSWNDASIIVPVPAGATNGNVIVTVGGVQSNGVSFTVLPTAGIINLSPTSGPVGTTVTITGTNFGATQSASIVTFAGTTATPTNWSATSITVPVPNGATTGNVIVTVDGGASNAVGFTVTPSLSITGLSPSSGMVGTLVTIAGTLFGATQGASTVVLNTVTAVVVSWSNTSIVAVVPAGATSGPFSVTVNGQLATSSSFIVTALPTGWLDTDVGTVSQAGSATYSGGTFTTAGAGGGTWSNADGMHFVYQTLVGDGSITARLTSLQSYGPSAYAEAGVMIRETLNPGSTNALVLYSDGVPCPGSRSTTNAGENVTIGLASGSLPQWMQLVRVGSALTVYISSDGVNWTQLGTTMTVSMAQTVYIGMFVSGINYLEPATFDNVSINSTANPAPLITALSPTTASVGSQVAITGNNFGTTQGGSLLLLNGVPITVTSWSNTGIAFTVPSGATSGLLAVSLAPSMNDSNPANLEVTTQPIPTSWINQDVTAVDTPIGSATFSGGIFTVTGAGGGLGGTADGMQFVYQTLTGDGSIIARLTSVQNTPYSGTDAGLMIRETLDPGSADAAVFYAGVSAYVYFQDRPTTGATANTVQGPYLGNAFPEWLELVRAGNTFTAFSSPDGVNWTQMGTTTTVTMAQTVYIGLAVSGFGTLEPATFDNVSINSSANPAPVITGLSATSAAVGSQVEITGNNFGATQNGSVLLLNGTSIAINLWSNTSIVFTVPVGATSGPLVVSVAPSMNDSNPVNLGVSADPLPTPWLNQDVGAVGTQTGSSTFSSGIFTVTGAGGGIGGTADGMQFVYQTLAGDGSIVARLTGLQNTPNSGTDAGVMIRETLNSGATDATVFYAGATGYLYFQDRPTTGATVSTTQGSYVGAAFPEWLEVVRAGNTFTGFSSPDGVNWTQIGTSTTITMAQTVYIGLAVSGFGTLEPATFDSVAVTVGTTPFVTGVTPIVGTIGTAVTIAGSNFGSTQGTSTVTFNGALATTITSWSNSQIVATVPSSAPNGMGPVIVTVNSITSPITTGALFTVISPIITSLEPPAGPVGGILTINGSGFGASQNGVISINGVNAGVYFNCPAGVLEPCWSDTQIQVVIPNTTSGVVTVSNDGIVSNSVQFTVSPPPVITSLSPTTGEPATVITVDGSGFGATQSDSTVAVGGINAPVSSWSDSQIIASVPNIPMNGVVTVTVAGNTAQGPLFIYNAINQLTASNGAVTTYNSGDFGNAWRLYSSAGPGCSTCSTRGNVANSFDNNGNLLSTTDANGNTITYTYDGNNNMLSQTAQLNGSPVTTSYTYNNLAEVLNMTDPLGNTTINTYDANGNLLTASSPAPNGQTPPSVTQFTYNTLGELTQILDPLNHPTAISYYPTGLIQSITDAQNHTTSYTYDSRGNRTSVIDPINGSSHPTSFAYDAMSRLTGITYPDGTTASFAYDSRGRRISATDQNGKTTTYAYDAADRLISVTDAASNLTQYGYDTEGDLTSITDANNHTTYFAYDTMGRVIQTTFPSTLTETYAYDQLYNLTSKTDRKGQIIQYVYDSLNRMISKTYPDSTAVDYIYDLIGKIQQVTDPTGTYAFAYDNMGRLIGTSTQYTFLPGHNFQNSYSYDAASNRTSLTAPDGSTNYYNYDTLNRLTTLTNSLTGQFGFGYDALSRRTQLTRPNGVNTNYNYDSVSHLLSVLHQAGSTTLDGASYGYDYAGNRTSKTNYLNGITSNYGYDAIYELLQVTQGGSTTESYSYDAVGNRLSSSGVPSYSYNSSNELASNSSGSYTYDANGNTLSDASGKSYSWDFENRLTQAVVPGTGTVAFKYDPLGRRIYKSSPSFTGISVYDGKDLIEEVDNSGTVLARYAFGPGLDQPLSMFRRSAASYYQADALSSATSLSNTAGTLANTYTYDSFGNPTASTGAPTNPFQYTGRQFDSETGLYYYRARYYDPGPGKFISEDPVRFEAGMNFYGYVRGNPVAYNDPLGLYGWSDAPIALLHYCGGSGTPWTTSFDSINWGSTMLDVWARIGLLAQGPCTERSAPISFTMGAQTAGADSAIIGRHSVRVTGVLQIHCDCTWTFQGEMSSARGYDTYTFYPSNRGPLGELSTWIGGHACTGMPFNIYLPGSLPVMDSGTIPGGTPTCCKNH